MHAESVLNSLRRVVLALRAWAQDAEADSGLSGAQLYVLQKLAEADAPSLNDLARRTLTSKAAVSVVVGRLVARGLIGRQASPGDARRVQFALTAAGRLAMRRAPLSPQERLLSGLRGLSERDLAALSASLGRLVAELGISTIEPRMLFEPPPSRSSTPRARPERGLARRR